MWKATTLITLAVIFFVFSSFCLSYVFLFCLLVLLQDQSTGKAKYGFLEFQELDAAVKTIEAYNGREVGGNTMAVGFAKPKGGAAPQQGGGGGGAQESSRLFVGNIGAGATVGQSAERANRQACKHGTCTRRCVDAAFADVRCYCRCVHCVQMRFALPSVSTAL